MGLEKGNEFGYLGENRTSDNCKIKKHPVGLSPNGTNRVQELGLRILLPTGARKRDGAIKMVTIQRPSRVRYRTTLTDKMSS